MRFRRVSVRRLIAILVTTISVAVWLMLFVFVAPAQTSETDVPKRVLALFWLGKDSGLNVELEQGVQMVLKSAPVGTVEYYAEYLESNRFPGEAQSVLFRDYLRLKYADQRIDVILAMSTTSLRFLIKYRHELFPAVPIVFYTRVRPELSNEKASPGFTGVFSAGAFRNTVDIALRLHPQTRRLLVISGTPEHDKTIERDLRQELAEFEQRVVITYLTDLQLHELISRVASAPEESVILYTRYSQDDPGKTLRPPEVLAMLGQVANVPIYGIHSKYVENGVVGGYVMNVEAGAAKTAEIGLRIANGELPQDIPVIEIESIPMFDWRQMRRWGIAEEQLPAGSIVRFREVTLWGQHRWRIIAVLT